MLSVVWGAVWYAVNRLCCMCLNLSSPVSETDNADRYNDREYKCHVTVSVLNSEDSTVTFTALRDARVLNQGNGESTCRRAN